MTHFTRIAMIAVAVLALGGTAQAATHSATHAPKPKFSMARAKAIALKAAPGTIKDSEYEKEGGGWRYSFDIRQKGHIQEIGVDAMTGKIVENKNEGKVDHD